MERINILQHASSGFVSTMHRHTTAAYPQIIERVLQIDQRVTLTHCEVDELLT